MFDDLVADFKSEQSAITRWWLEHSVDHLNGGFFGAIDNENKVVENANKGVIMNTRILWYFSAAAKQTQSSEEAYAAHRAYDYLVSNFLDKKYGGVFWELDSKGRVINGRKKIYAQAFAVFALSAYFDLTADLEALTIAQGLFELIEAHGANCLNGGYFESFNQDWSATSELRLSEKDPNWPKTMNTHLHVLEAYTTLYRVSPTLPLEKALKNLIEIFLTRFITDTHHLVCFFDDDWKDQSEVVSYGHDIEASWLIWEAVESLDCIELKKRAKSTILAVVNNCLDKGIGHHNELLDGFDIKKHCPIDERVWWIQAEAIVGCINAYQLTGDKKYINVLKGIWSFVKEYQIDKEFGEWRWLSSLDTSTRFDNHKAGAWKGPYHNGRAMLEAARRLKVLG